MIPRLAVLTALCTISIAIPASPPPYPAHCECRCCTRTHFHTICPNPPQAVPLSERYACDTRYPNSHNPSVCGPALCKAHFAESCPPPAFMQHACVSDRGVFHDWGPLAFVSLALLLSAYAANIIAARVPIHTIKTGYERPAGMEPGNDVCQPLVSTSALAASYGVEVIDVSPRRVVTMPISPPSGALSESAQANSFPMYRPPTSSRHQSVITSAPHLSPVLSALPSTRNSNETVVLAGDSEDEDEGKGKT